MKKKMTNVLAMNENKIKKQFWPILIYSGNAILYSIKGESFLFYFILNIITMFCAVIMGRNIWKLTSMRCKISIYELLYCISVYLVSRYAVQYIGNILASICIVVLFVVYINYINPKILKRILIL